MQLLRTLLLCVGTCCLLNALQAQHPSELDSIKRVIATAKHDTTRLEAMVALSERIYMADPDTNLIICRDALRKAERALLRSDLNKQERKVLLRIKGTAINNMAVSYFIFGELDSALLFFEQAEKVHAANSQTGRWADALNNQSQVLGLLGRHAEQRRRLFQALAVYQGVHDGINTGNALNNIGNYYAERGLPDSALIFLDSSLVVFTNLKDPLGMANSLLNIGMNHVQRGRPAEALEKLVASEKLYAALKNDPGLAVCLNNIGSLYKDQGILEESINYFHRALDLHLARGAKLNEANVRMNLGTVLEEQGETDMALREFEQALTINNASGDRAGEALVHGHLGDLWKNKGDRTKALEHLQTSLSISQAMDDPKGIGNALYKLGHFYEDIGELENALTNYRESLSIDERLQDRESASFSLFSIANIRLKQGKPKEAEMVAERSLAIAQELGYPVNIMRATQVLNEALAKQGKWGRALEMLELHQQMKDSVNNAENAKKTIRLQMRYDFEKEQLADSLAHAVELGELENEKRIATLQGEQARNRSWAFGLGGLLLLGGGGVVYRIDRKRRRERFERDAAQLQTQILRTQMNPHFIFNALTSINNYVQENERELASDFLTKFARLMRLVLENSRHSEVTLVQDLEALRLYMDLEQSRMRGKFDFTIEVDPAIDQETTLVPPLVVQPFVENAIWHGISRKEGKGHITLTVHLSAGQLIMTVEDDGVGRNTPDPSPSTDVPPKTSLGTTITKDRLAMLGQQRGADAGFQYLDLPTGTRVVVTLPLFRDH